MRASILLVAFAGAAWATAGAQTTAGTSATIVVPVVAQTGSFTSEVTLYNPNAGAITLSVAFFNAQNTMSPGPKPATRWCCLPAAARRLPWRRSARCRRSLVSAC